MRNFNKKSLGPPESPAGQNSAAARKTDSRMGKWLEQVGKEVARECEVTEAVAREAVRRVMASGLVDVDVVQYAHVFLRVEAGKNK